MASVRRNTYTKPIPEGAKIVTIKGEQFAKFKGKDGRATKAKLTKDGTKCLFESKVYYVFYTDADGVRRSKKGFTDKEATQQLAAKVARNVELGQAGMVDRYAEHLKRSLAEHLDDYEQHLRDKGNSAKYVKETAEKARAVVSGGEFVLIRDITPSRVEGVLGALRRQGRSIQTSNHYLAAIKQFCRWLVTDHRIETSPIAHLKKMNARTDRRHDRRPLTSDEFGALIGSAMSGPAVQRVSGPDRAMLYIVAAWTGYRRAELASLTLRSLDFESDPPTIRVEAGYSKRRKTDTVPLHPVVVDRLQAWLETRDPIGPDEPLFALKTKSGAIRATSKMMKKDLKRAGIPYQDEAGLFADFHSNRHTFISNLSIAGVSPKMAQTLARHSDVNMTLNIYTHVRRDAQSEAVRSLPAPPRLKRAAAFLNRDPRPRQSGEHVQKHVDTIDVSCHPESRVGTLGDDDEPDPRVLRGDASGAPVPACRSVAMRDSTGTNALVAMSRRSTEPEVTGSNPVASQSSIWSMRPGTGTTMRRWPWSITEIRYGQTESGMLIGKRTTFIHSRTSASPAEIPRCSVCRHRWT